MKLALSLIAVPAAGGGTVATLNVTSIGADGEHRTVYANHLIKLEDGSHDVEDEDLLAWSAQLTSELAMAIAEEYAKRFQTSITDANASVVDTIEKVRAG